MKKRAMKKWIPKNTIYCDDCKWRKFIKTIKYNRNTYCPYVDKCNEKCWSNLSTSCQINVYKCEYLNYIDLNEDSLLWDGCKVCNVSRHLFNRKFY